MKKSCLSHLSPFLTGLKNPLFRIVDHGNEHSENLLIAFTQFGTVSGQDVFVRDREVDPCLRLSSLRLGDIHGAEEMLFVSPLPPRFCDIRGNTSRRTSDLVRQRIHLFSRKTLRDLKNLARCSKRLLIDQQVSMALDNAHGSGHVKAEVNGRARILLFLLTPFSSLLTGLSCLTSSFAFA